MKQLCLRVLILVTALGLAGCTALLPSSSAVSPSSFDSFEAAQAALEKTVPYKTTLEELKALGFDPQASANVSIIPYPEVVSRLAPYSGVALDALDPGVRDCILAQTQCKAYVYRFGRVGSPARRKLSSWISSTSTAMCRCAAGASRAWWWCVNGIVLFRNSAGESKLNTFDATERTINPLGPFQRSGESSDLLLR
jgi:hypothetical protein